MRPDKRELVIDGALRCFARDGYTRASIQSLAAEAGVSTRTIYNHFGNKEALFRATILDSAQRVAARQIALMDRLLSRVGDVRGDLETFGRAWAAPDPASGPHFEMVRQIQADADHIDPETLTAWRDAGPLRVRAALARHLGGWQEQGLLTLADPELAAVHLVALTAGAVEAAGPSHSSDEVVRAGVDVFLRAYATQTARLR